MRNGYVHQFHQALQRTCSGACGGAHRGSVHSRHRPIPCSDSGEVVFSTVSLLFMGKFLEPVWGSKEFLKFIFVVNFLTYLCVFVTAIALYYITRLEIYLYLQRRPETKLRGDPSDDFAFSTFFPELLRERGARALEERLATERLVPPRNKDESQSDALDSV
ncbi:unnamed protein product [Thlaspi arvense]|uniref:Uncharacterized protein n=1 Tax=Thlaspi arvense TaxID=13288 RepID=A0AAU9S5H8_THLAR|nr:unnamed protein product [Thlaspi arvense]